MNYEIVELEKKTIVGVSAFTSNEDPKMGEIIGALWNKMYEGGVSFTIKNKVNEHAIGLYSDYSKDGYCVTVGHEVALTENAELIVKMIPAGRYAKFSVHGNMVGAVQKAWGEIWSMALDRSYTGDFEEYLNNDWDHADINIYIALK